MGHAKQLFGAIVRRFEQAAFYQPGNYGEAELNVQPTYLAGCSP
jgi:hypothetical protein